MAVNGSTAARGYDHTHQKLRAWWKPYVDAGQVLCHAVICLMPTRLIIPNPALPGDGWDLGHPPDRNGWTGPEHSKCNRAEGARRGNRLRRKRPALRLSRIW